ncbi:MAG TPA: glutamate racemase [Spirochaetota bacterium]|mgnify:FL=1|nr:glutamate racemase [Spirochaetota bacterium]HOS33749.1 glutamate racemase [Spirochaetota bacterium]HOS56779.1 glutamate racemase [Spirochaetota bacterium]HPK62646.1 glutamate racemase [Spirochaetota bacterium]HQF76830.1 glutamate racemase [Spirochaetota bacterium]
MITKETKEREFILFIDSGIGGLSILKYFLSLKQNANVIYFADNYNFPYGVKSEGDIAEILLSIYFTLKDEFKISLIAIACNTASVNAIDILRSADGVPQIVGTVPAIKTAASLTKNNKIGVIATESTIKQNYIQNLITKFAKNKEVFLKSSRKLVEAAENFYPTDTVKNIVAEELSYFKEVGIDALALGCTHYSFLFEEIEDFFGPNVRIIDSREGVAKRINSIAPSSVFSENPEKILLLSKIDKEALKKYVKFNEILDIFNKIDFKEIRHFKS